MGRPGNVGLRWCLAVLAALALSACGEDVHWAFVVDNGVAYYDDGVCYDGGTVVIVGYGALIETDVDGDGGTDLLAVDRDGAGVQGAWRDEGPEGFAPAPSSWWDSDALRAVLEDLGGRDDDALRDEGGVHRLPWAGGRDLSYAVRHLGRGVPDAAEAPLLEDLGPGSGAVGSLVHLSGEGLAARTAPPSVTFGSVPAQVLFAFADRLVVAVPEGLAPGPVDVWVTVDGVASAPWPFTVR